MVPRRLCFFGSPFAHPRGRRGRPAKLQRVLVRLIVVWLLLLVKLLASAGCGGAQAGKVPAATGVQSLIDALAADDPRRAYALLTADIKRDLPYHTFAEQWQRSMAERAWQAEALRASLRGAPDVGERAVVGFSDGKSVPLERDGKLWRLEVPLVTRATAPRPRDAVRQLAAALAERDVTAALATLSKRRREGIARQIEGFLEGLGKRVDEPIDEYGEDHAELRWDEGGFRYRVMLLREEGEWRVDDLSIRPAPGEDEEDRGDE